MTIWMLTARAGCWLPLRHDWIMRETGLRRDRHTFEHFNMLISRGFLRVVASKTIPSELEAEDIVRKKGEEEGPPAPPPPPPTVLFPCQKGLSFEVPEELIGELRTDFPLVMIEIELRNALAWVHKNRPKTHKGMPLFLRNWMTTATKDAAAGQTPRAREEGPYLAPPEETASEYPEVHKCRTCTKQTTADRCARCVSGVGVHAQR